MMKFKIGDIRANPFRHIERYPYREDKITALRESLRTTGFWDNVVARVVDSVPQIAYGHHRLEALHREYDPDHEVNLIVRDLPDDQMLKIMARENMEEWGTSAAIEHETVRAVVEAYAAGQIELPDPRGSGVRADQVRWAPSFIPGAKGDLVPARGLGPYTAQTIADFLGWTQADGGPQSKVHDALSALALIEEGALTEEDFAGLTTKQAQAVIEQTRRARAAAEAHARREAERAEAARRQAEEARKARERAERERQQREEQARKARERQDAQKAERWAQQAEDARQRAEAEEARRQQAERERREAEERSRERREEGRQQATNTGRHVGQQLRGGRGYREADQIAAEIRPQPKGDQPPPDIDTYARRIARQIHELLDLEYNQLARNLNELIKFRAHLSPAVRQELRRTLGGLAARTEDFRTRLGGTENGDDAVDAEIVPTITPPKEITA